MIIILERYNASTLSAVGGSLFNNCQIKIMCGREKLQQRLGKSVIALATSEHYRVHLIKIINK